MATTSDGAARSDEFTKRAGMTDKSREREVGAPERPAPAKLPAVEEPQRSQKLPKAPKPRKVEKRQRGRKG